jgi:hypothetical protein
MSTPSPSSPSLHPTRRQLDELDALMEKMLELPVNPVVEQVQHPGSEEPASPPPDGASALGDSPLGEFASHGFVSYRTDENDASVTSPAQAMAFHFAEPKLAVVNPVSPNRIVIARTSAGLADDGPPPPLWLWPVAGINQMYDALMGGLGTPGRIMRGTGRKLIGWIGLLLLAAALAWGVLDWLQWAG